jgi:hypothetical protein
MVTNKSFAFNVRTHEKQFRKIILFSLNHTSAAKPYLQVLFIRLNLLFKITIQRIQSLCLLTHGIDYLIVDFKTLRGKMNVLSNHVH